MARGSRTGRGSLETSVDDVVAVILALATQRQEVTGKRSQVHKAFAAATERFPNILTTLCFSQHSSPPCSERLNRIIFRLQGIGLLGLPCDPRPKMTMPDKARRIILSRYEQRVRQALPHLDEIVAFMCSPENPTNLLLRQPAPAPLR